MKKPILIIAIISSCLLLFLLVENFNMTSIYSYFFGEDDMYIPTYYATGSGNAYPNTSTGFSLSERNSVFDSNDKVPSAYSNTSISGSPSRKAGSYFDNSTAATSSVTLGNTNYLGLVSSAESNNNGYHISKAAPVASDGFSVQQSASTMQALVASTKSNSSTARNLAINSSTLPSANTYGKISSVGGLSRAFDDDDDPTVGGDTGDYEDPYNRNDMPVGGGLGIMLLMAGFYFVTKRRKNMISRA